MSTVLRTMLLTALCCACSDSRPKPVEPPPSKAAAPVSKPAEKLRIGYSDWPGFVAWEIALQKGWFEEAGVGVEFVWFEYSPSLEAFSAGKLDAVGITNGDALVTGAGGARSVSIILNDYSDGNDMIVARHGLERVTDLKGKKVGVELGFVSHLLLMKALELHKMSLSELTLVNVPTDQTAQLLKAGEVDAIVAWQPNSGQALKEVSGSKPIFTSSDVPGLIYDMLVVSPKSLAERRDAWKQVAKVWFRVVDFLRNPANYEEAATRMATRVGLKPEQYKPLIKGTHFLDLAGNVAHFKHGETLESVYFSSQIADAFQVANGVYKASVPYEQYFDPSLVGEVLAERATARATQ
jgi:NitT/TauT family transport system substrate-binding protein